MTNTSQRNWKNTFTITILSAYFYTFMEWLFFVTKPSSLSMLTLFAKFKVLFITGGITALLFAVAFAILSLPVRLNSKVKFLAHVPAAFILSVTILILLDNFTYTVFKFGIISTGGLFRAVYALGFLIIIWRMIQLTQHINLTNRKSASFLTIGLLTLSMAGILSENLSNNPYTQGSSSSTSNLPNIIILGGDGLSANFMSAYGYSQETTPFLTELAKTSLVAENAFPNASSTTASTTSVLTGKEPVSVNVLRYPDILSGDDSFEHLPGILKRHGYKTVEIGVSYYVDAQRLNLLDGFDIVNNRSLNLPAIETLRYVLGNSPSIYFIQTITERASERLLHIFYVRDMENPLAGVTNPNSRMSDEDRVGQIIQLVDEADRPVFIFAHLMDTHGPEFSSDYHVFSDGSSDSEEEWNSDHYKDALLSYDAHVKEVYDYLDRSGKLNNTILLVYTDHGYRYVVNQRIPVIIHFPNASEAGLRHNNIQNIDIPVTILDYLDISIPDWMTGISMLGDEPPADREIISITAGSPKKIGPPFYQIKIAQIIVCQKWYYLNVQENEWKSGLISRHTSNCDDDLLPPDEEIHQRILNYLEEYKYDVSSLQ